MRAPIKMTDALRIFPYYPKKVFLLPLYDDVTGKYAIMITEALPNGKDGRTLYSMKEAIFPNEQQAVISTVEMLRRTMEVVKIMMN